ncbi:MAG TPA: hypothetical protein PK507_03175 [bacterium]|mgnify:CR=1 FL=1|jgi:hypothetical protein|nr:hypothetical protein [bacterium]
MTKPYFKTEKLNYLEPKIVKKDIVKQKSIKSNMVNKIKEVLK